MATSRREMMLSSINIPIVLGSVLSIGAAPRPSNVGIQTFGSVKTLSLCPPTPNCIATSEEANDPTHYVPAWTYNPEDGRGLRKPASQAQAMEELVSVVKELKPDGFEPTIIKQTNDYLYLEYESPFFGFKDDVEFYFAPDDRQGKARVEYRSASRIGESDGDVNRKRIKAIRQALEKKGWRSVGF